MILGKYVNWNQAAERMIRAHEDNMTALEIKREQLKEMEAATGGLKAIQYDKDRVQTTPTSEGMVNALIQKEELRQAVRDLETENRLYTRAWGMLADDEKNVLRVFFQQGLSKEDAVCMIGEQYECERTKVYDMRRSSLQRFKQFLI